MDEDALKLYQRLMGNIWDRVVRTLGVHTALVLAERALWMTRQRHDGTSKIAISEGGVSFSGLCAAVSPEQAALIAEEMLESLASLITRLLGVEMSRKVAEEIDNMLKASQEAGHGQDPHGY